MILKGKHAKEFGYLLYVGMDVTPTGKEKNGKVEVKAKIKDVPFPVSILVHREDITNG